MCSHDHRRRLNQTRCKERLFFLSYLEINFPVFVDVELVKQLLREATDREKPVAARMIKQATSYSL